MTATMHSAEEMPDRFVSAWNDRDAGAIADLFAEDADFVNVVGLWWSDRESIRKAHEYGLRVIFPDSNLSVVRRKVRYLSDDVAVVHARMRLRGQSDAGDTSAFGRQTVFTFVMQRRSDADGWICVSAQNTDIVMGAETNLRTGDGELKGVSYR